MEVFKSTRVWNAVFLVATLLISGLFDIHSVHSQSEPKAQLIDQYRSSLSCHDIRSRIEMLMEELAGAPDTTGVVVIQGAEDEPLSAFQHRLLLLGYINIRRFQSKRITFLRGEDRKTLGVQLWKVPLGSVLPREGTKEWSYKLPTALTSVKLYQSSSINEECPETFNLKEYTQFLSENPRLTGQIVITARSKKTFEKKRRTILRDLRQIPTDITRFDFKFLQSDAEDIVYWLSSKN